MSIYPAALATQWLIDALTSNQHLRWWLQFGSHRLLFEQVLADTVVASLWTLLWLFNFVAAYFIARAIGNKLLTVSLPYGIPILLLGYFIAGGWPALLIWMVVWALVATVAAQWWVRL